MCSYYLHASNLTLSSGLEGGSPARPVLPLHFPPSQLPSLLSQHLNRVRQVKCGRWVVLTGDIQYRLGVLLNYGMLKQKFKGFAKYANSSFRTQCGQKAKRATHRHIFECTPITDSQHCIFGKNLCCFECFLDDFVVP